MVKSDGSSFSCIDYGAVVIALRATVARQLVSLLRVQ